MKITDPRQKRGHSSGVVKKMVSGRSYREKKFALKWHQWEDDLLTELVDKINRSSPRRKATKIGVFRKGIALMIEALKEEYFDDITDLSSQEIELKD